MTVFLRAHDISLDLPLDLQRAGADGAGFKSALGGSVRRYARVLSQIDFAAHEGDRIAVMGLNGAGKTTLLRVLNGAFPPSRGSVERHGSVQSLLNSMLGFSEYASVAENILLRGTAMGLRRRQLEAVASDILEFAGLRDRASYRLHTLSAGQRTRLGFAISTAVQPDILLMDEWIGTGDAAFIERARDRMLGRFHNSRIVVLASHGTDLQKRLCNKALVLDQGRMRHFGDIEQGMAIYREIVAGASAELRAQAVAQDPLLFGDTRGLIERISVRGRTVEVEGWAIGEHGREVEVLRVELDGLSQVLERFDRVGRDDVLRAMGKRAGRFGFRFAVDHEHAIDAGDIAARLRVSAGRNARQLSLPLGMAPGGVVEAA